jgi:hypothetical protein
VIQDVVSDDLSCEARHNQDDILECIEVDTRYDRTIEPTLTAR